MSWTVTSSQRQATTLSGTELLHRGATGGFTLRDRVAELEGAAARADRPHEGRIGPPVGARCVDDEAALFEAHLRTGLHRDLERRRRRGRQHDGVAREPLDLAVVRDLDPFHYGATADAPHGVERDGSDDSGA